MADVQSQVRHITALDFDTSRALAQLAELKSQIDTVTSKIANNNWTINAIINGQSDYANLRKELDTLRGQYTTLTNQLITAKKQILDMQEAHHQAAENMTQDTSRLASTIETRLVSVLEQAAVAAAKTVKSTEDSMVEISRVLELSGSQADSMREKLFGLGNEFGRSFEDVSAIALRYAQAGYDMNDTLTQTKGFLLALNTAELDVENGVQSLIGIMSQWGMEASELESVIDKLNYTADTNAITTQDLVDGLLKASSMAKTAGMSFDETVGSLTALKVASGAAGKEVGNAFKSILAYIQRPDSLKVFDSMGIEVYADRVTGELIPMMDILENMSKKWNEGAASQQNMIDTLVKSGDALQMMSEEWAIATDSIDEYNQYQEAMAEATDKANTAEARAQAQAAAGVFRRNYYISLMENFANAVEVSNNLVNAEGHSMKENSRYMETLTAKCEQLVVSLKELAVTAADAGLLDLAKDSIELATGITKWTTASGNLIPVLTTVSGLLITIKSQKIANEMTSIGNSFANAYKTISGVNTGLSGLIGTVGLGVSAVSGAVAVIKTIEAASDARIKKMQDERNAIIENAAAEEKRVKVVGSTIDEYEKLSGRYDELRNKTELTADEEKELLEITDSLTSAKSNLIDKYGALADNIDLVNGKYDTEIAKLRELNKQQLLVLENAQKSAIEAAERNNYLNEATGTGSIRYTDGREGQAADVAAKVMNSAGLLGDGLTPAGFTDSNTGGKAGEDIVITLSNTREAADAAAEALKRLEEAGLEHTGYYAALSNAQQAVIENLDGIREQEHALADTLFQQYINDEANAIDKLTAKSFPDWKRGLLDVEDVSMETKAALGAMASELEGKVYANAFNELFKGFPEAREELAALSAEGKLNAETFDEVINKNGELAKGFEESGLLTTWCVNLFNSMKGSLSGVSEGTATAAQDMGDFEEKIILTAKEMQSLEKEITTLNGYIETLNKGNGLTAEQVMELCDTYGLLLDQFTLTEQGYTIEVSALETLRDAQIETAAAARKAQAENTLITSQNVMERISAYGLEITSLTNVMEAEAALIQLEGERAKLTSKINSAGDANYYASQVAEIDDIIGNVRILRDEYSNIDAMAEDLYKNLGKSFESAAGSSKAASSEAEKTVDVLKELTDGYEKLVALGLYSTEEQIAYYEDLRRSLDLTMEQYEKLEATLHKLYKTQLEESKAAAKEEYENYKKTKEDEYKAAKEALEKQLSDEKDARKQYWADELDKLKSNLNAQISAAKSAYEEKKKLAQKSHDNQVKALESLRDMEIDNINSVYNAQIDALEKIKAARNSERSEEDYQDERAELLEQISYYEQRTGTEAVENLKNLRKQLADLDKRRKREVEDEQTDKQIESLKSQRDSETAEAEKYYNARIAALKTANDTEVEMYEETYKREVELLQNRLDTETKALEKKRDADLKRLDEEQAKKLKDLEDEKNAAIKAADEKWEQLQKIFEDGNLALIAAAGEFAPELYDKFHEEFAKNFEADLKELEKLMKELDSQKSSFQYASGSKPTASAPKAVSGSASSSSSSSSNKNSGGGFSVGTQVKVSGTLYGSSYGDNPGKTVNGQKTTIMQINSSGTKPYRVGSLGWVDASQLVKAKTGGRTTSDGLAMLHKDELVVNPPTLKKLEDFLEKFKPEPYEFKPRIFEAMAREQAKMLRVIQNHNNTYFNSNSSVQNNGGDDYSSTRRNVQNFNGPLMNIERVEDDVDMQAAMNEMERIIMRDINTRL